MLLIHFFHLLLLVLPANLLSATFDILDISCDFCTFSQLPKLASVFIFGLKLTSLVFIKPGNSFHIDIDLLESVNAFTKDLFDSGYSEEYEGVSNHAYVDILELKDIP